MCHTVDRVRLLLMEPLGVVVRSLMQYIFAIAVPLFLPYVVEIQLIYAFQKSRIISMQITELLWDKSP